MAMSLLGITELFSFSRFKYFSILSFFPLGMEDIHNKKKMPRYSIG